jgi:DNA-binding GntR family transcriptional regulator
MDGQSKRADEPSKHASASERLLERIGDCIFSGEFAPGARLTEHGLAERFGVGRAPLREALFRLEERQLIERAPFSSMRVAPISVRMIEEMYEIREVLEGLACRRAATIISVEQIGELRAALAARARALQDHRDRDMRHQPTIQDFHQSIATVSGNRELERLLSSEIWCYMRALYSRWARPERRAARGPIEHERIVDALESHDHEFAELLMRRHIASARIDLMSARAGADFSDDR